MIHYSPQLRYTVLIFLTLIFADTIAAQVIIRERVEITPQVPVEALQSVSIDSSFTIEINWTVGENTFYIFTSTVTGPCDWTPELISSSPHAKTYRIPYIGSGVYTQIFLRHVGAVEAQVTVRIYLRDELERTQTYTMPPFLSGPSQPQVVLGLGSSFPVYAP
ncbi:MAG TPA: hypothetical protein VII11_02970, partial [Bacteroidota bacterium]